VRRCLRDPTFSRFDTIPECDRHTHTHTMTAYTALSNASRGKNEYLFKPVMAVYLTFDVLKLKIYCYIRAENAYPSVQSSFGVNPKFCLNVYIIYICPHIQMVVYSNNIGSTCIRGLSSALCVNHS